MSDLFNEFQQRFNEEGGARKSISGVLILGAIAMVFIFGYTMFYRIEASDQGVVLRFGKHIDTVEPGLHVKMPWPIDSVYSVAVRRIDSIEFGFQTVQAGRKTAYALKNQKMSDVADMLTGDLNLAHVEWIVQVRIRDPYDSLFNIGTGGSSNWGTLSRSNSSHVNPALADTIKDVSETIMRKLVGDRSVDSILTMGREEIASQAKTEIQEMMDQFKSGVEIVTVKLQTTSPPESVKDAFQDVNRARQNKERVVNQAEGERNRQIPAARGKRDQLISEAEGYRDRVLLETKGRTAAFASKLAEFEKFPEVTRKRLYLEAMQDVLGNVGDKTIIDESVNQMLPILDLNNRQSKSNPLRGGNK